jgi:hypothetical protein
MTADRIQWRSNGATVTVGRLPMFGPIGLHLGDGVTVKISRADLFEIRPGTFRVAPGARVTITGTLSEDLTLHLTRGDSS